MPGTAPVITSQGGAANANLTVAENETFVANIVASDAELNTLTYSLSGADKNLFKIVIVAGVVQLQFVSGRDFENRSDVGLDGIYDVTVTVSDGTLTDSIALAVTVTNVNPVTLTLNGVINGSTEGGDSLTGGAGADTINGLTGADIMNGAGGNDIYFVDNVGDLVGDTSGTDLVNSTISYSLIDTDGAGVNGGGIENLTLLGTNSINATGNAAANILIGNSGNNIMDGGALGDTMTGGLGSDTYYVDVAGDLVVEADVVGTDTVFSAINYTLVGTFLENLNLTGTAANGTGNEANNTLKGNASANLLIANGGNDFIDGGAGVDSMTGGLGDDTYVVDNASDVVNEADNLGVTSGGIDSVQSSVTFSLTGTAAGVENLTLTGTAVSGTGNLLANNIIGNASNNTLLGDEGADTLNGGAGADAMTGGNGADTYFVDNASDTVVETAIGEIDQVFSSVSFTLGALLENLTLTGSAVSATGNNAANYLKGNAAANLLTDNNGNDTLDGGTGADSMAGGLGNDIYIVDNASDIVTELVGGGNDTVNSSVSYSLVDTDGAGANGGNVDNLTLTGVSSISGTGNSLDNKITGNTSANVLNGGGGNDTLDGGSGTDTMIGGDGDDTYFVGVAADVVDETLTAGTDTVKASSSYTIGINVENLTLTGTAAVNGTGNGLANVLTGNASANILTGAAGNDTLNGLGGADTLLGGDNNDTMNGGINNDTLNGGLGQDTLTGGIGNDKFVFSTIADSLAGSQDVIADYTKGDKIDLSAIDAKFDALNGDQAFVIDTDNVFVEGEIGIVDNGLGVLTISLFNNAAAGADMVFTVNLAVGTTAADFIL